MWASLLLTFAILAGGGEGETARGVTLRASNAVTDEAPGLFTRVRSTERFMIALLREGYDQSPAFRDLVDLLQQSNVIVFVQPASCAGGRIRSCLVSVNGSQRERHIRINVDTHTSHEWLIATMAHELQHAVEIAEHPEVFDSSATLTLYRQIAFGRCREGLSDECETTRALATERHVLEELYRHMTRGALTALPAGGTTAPPSPRVRSTDARMLDLLREGIARSVTFRELVDAIAQSTGIVYVESGHCAFGHLNGCLLPFIASTHGDRYLRILVTPDRNRVTHDQRLALIAHELRHALEVIEHEEVVDLATLEAMYRRTGVPLTGGLSGYETSAARATSDRVLSELLANPAP